MGILNDEDSPAAVISDVIICVAVLFEPMLCVRVSLPCICANNSALPSMVKSEFFKASKTASTLGAGIFANAFDKDPKGIGAHDHAGDADDDKAP